MRVINTFGFVALLFCSVQAQALPTSAVVSIDVESLGSDNSVLNVTNTFNEAPSSGERCRVDIFGSVSQIPAEGIDRGVRRIGRKTNLRRRTARFSAQIDPVRLTNAVQTQLNVQSRSVCQDGSNNTATIVSDTVSTNVTCTRGITRRSFILRLADQLEFTRSSNSSGALSSVARVSGARVCRAG